MKCVMCSVSGLFWLMLVRLVLVLRLECLDGLRTSSAAVSSDRGLTLMTGDRWSDSVSGACGWIKISVSPLHMPYHTLPLITRNALISDVMLMHFTCLLVRLKSEWRERERERDGSSFSCFVALVSFYHDRPFSCSPFHSPRGD